MALTVVADVFKVFSSRISRLFSDFWELEQNFQLLNNELHRLEQRLRQIEKKYADQQRQPPELVEQCLERTSNAVAEADALIVRADRERERYFGWGVFCSPKIPTEIRNLRTTCTDLSRQLNYLEPDVGPSRHQAGLLLQPLPDSTLVGSGTEASQLSTAAHTAEIVGSAQPQAEVLLQPTPDSGFVGFGFGSAMQQLLYWLNNPHPQALVIGLWGMAGVGKTAILHVIYNYCKGKVSTSFDLVIWHTISRKYEIDSLQHTIADSKSQTYQIQSLQDTIAEHLSLDLKGISSVETRKTKLYASLENKRFLLVLDDLWSPINLNEVGVNFGRDKISRVLISSRSRDVVEIMAEKEYCRMIRPLSEDEGWALFHSRAFKSGAALKANVEVIARQVASECKGLPLAINTVAAAMARKETAQEWSLALDLMKNADPSFPLIHKTIEVELYQKLRRSYENLPNHGLKMCFLYCAAFPEDANIDVERLVEMWTAERLFLQKGKTYFMDAGRKCIQALVDRCLIEYVDTEEREIKVHDVLRDMAIYVGQGEENWLFQAGQHLKHFPSEEETRDCKRISVLGNEISDLPPDFKCPTLVSLVLAGNRELKEIPQGFWVNCMSLKVLDLSDTSIQTLPTAVGRLGQLELLNLRGCRELEDLPDSICSLSHLQFLNLENCRRLHSLPDKIGELKNLKHLTVSGSYNVSVRVIPHQISQLTSLNKLVLRPESTPMCLEDLTNLSNLIELYVTVKPEIKGGTMSTWSKMRKLRLRFEWGKDEKRDDAALDILPQNMQSMEELQSLELEYYEGVSLPTCICQFQNLKNLNLSYCKKLEQLPCGGFAELQRLNLRYLSSLESVVCNAKTMSQLQTLNISYCSALKTLRMEKLSNLRELDIWACDELKELFMESGGCFPQLEELALGYLGSLESIVCNAKTMPQLHFLKIRYCGGLKTLRMEELPNLRKLDIKDCAELKVLFMESGGCFPELEELSLSSLHSLESIVCNAKTMPQLHSLRISDCRGLKTLKMEELPNLRELGIRDCAELKELFMESGGCFPQLMKLKMEELPNLKTLRMEELPNLKTLRMEELPNLRKLWIADCAQLKELFMESGDCFPQLKQLSLSSLHSLESIVCNAKTMPQLRSLHISDCGRLKTLRMEEFPDLQYIWIYTCPELEVEIGSLPMLKELHLAGLEKAESIARPSSVWNSDTMPNLDVVQITGCPLLRRMPREMEKLPNLKEIVGNLDWWDGISWENNNVKSELSHLFKEFGDEEESDEDIESEVAECDEDSEFEGGGEVEEREGGGEDDHQD